MTIAFKTIFRLDVEATPQIIGDVPMGFFRRPDGLTHLDVQAQFKMRAKNRY